jgi:hypothetical protein
VVLRSGGSWSFYATACRVVQFFFNSKNAIQGIQGNETKEREAFRLMYPNFVTVCRERKAEIERRLGSGMNTAS